MSKRFLAVALSAVGLSLTAAAIYATKSASTSIAGRSDVRPDLEGGRALFVVLIPSI